MILGFKKIVPFSVNEVIGVRRRESKEYNHLDVFVDAVGQILI